MSKTPIHRTVFKIEVLSEGPLKLSPNDNDPFDLEAINYEITEGACLGMVTEVPSEGRELRESEVRDACLKLGNDGEFFDYRDDYDEE